MTEDLDQPGFPSIQPHFQSAPGMQVEFPRGSAPTHEVRSYDAHRLLTQRTLELTLIQDAGVRLTRELDLSAICRTLRELITQVMPCGSLVVSSYDRTEKFIRAEYIWHDGEEVDPSEFPPLEFDVGMPLAQDTGTQGRAIHTGKSLLLNDFEAYVHGVPAYFYEDGEVFAQNQAFERTPPEIETTRAALIVPLKLDAAVTGIVQVFSYEINAFSADQLHFLEALAPQVATALQNGRLHKELRIANAKLETANAELEARVEARTMELQQALAQQREINAFRAHLVSMVAHDFRTPLAAIHSITETLEHYSDRLSAEKRAEKFRGIREQIQHLVSIVEETILVGQSDSAALHPHLKPTDVVEVVQGVCATVRSKWPARTIDCSTGGTARPLSLDPVMLRRAITNLLTNAVKYSAAPAAVTGDVVFGEDAVQIRVRDEGIGIPAEDLEHLFEPFHRGGNVSAIKGTGLGLVIAQRMTAAMGGTIHLESAEGQGTTATLEFPYG